jgi:geranylgeranyl reductase family protein
MKYDVIVSGAGPAGSIASLYLARLGHEVLLVDSKSFPRNKVCGDLLPPAGLQLIRNMELDEQVICKKFNPIHRAHLFGPFDVELPVHFDFQGNDPQIAIISRSLFDSQLVRAAESAGAQRCAGRTCGLHYEHDAVVLTIRGEQSCKNYRARAVIGADGAGSFIARQLGLLPWKHRAVAIRGYVTGLSLEPHTVEGHFHPVLWPGYAWIFPTHANSANIGLGMDVRYYRRRKQNLRQLFQKFLHLPRIRNRLAKDYILRQCESWPINLGPPVWRRLAGNRCMLVGDAAGLANPLTGGGIANAMISGKIAAEVLAENLCKNTLSRTHLKEYERRIKKTLGTELGLSSKASRILSVSPYCVERMFQSAYLTPLTYEFINHIYRDVSIEQVRYDRHEGIILSLRTRSCL